MKTNLEFSFTLYYEVTDRIDSDLIYYYGTSLVDAFGACVEYPESKLDITLSTHRNHDSENSGNSFPEDSPLELR